MDGATGADVVEGGAHPVEGHAGELGPGEAVERELERVGGLVAVGLPVDDEVAVTVGRLGVHRVDPAADDLPGEHQREGRLDRVGRAVAERPVLERLTHLPEVGLVVDARVGATGQLVGLDAGPAGRTDPRPRRGTPCRSGRPAPAAAASAGRARARTPRGPRAAGRARSRTGCRAAGGRPWWRARRGPPRGAAARSSSHSATRAASTMSRPSSGAVGSTERTSSAAASRRRASSPGAGHRPRARRVDVVVGVGRLRRRLLQPALDRPAPLLELVAHHPLVVRRTERRRALAPDVGRHARWWAARV